MTAAEYAVLQGFYLRVRDLQFQFSSNLELHSQRRSLTGIGHVIDEWGAFLRTSIVDTASKFYVTLPCN
jgi:hypothetical protein